MKDIVLAIIIVVVLVGSVAFTLIGGYLDYTRKDTRTQIATESGCEYLGASRDIHQVGFYNCNGSVVMKLDK
jgi:hypothetical protein